MASHIRFQVPEFIAVEAMKLKQNFCTRVHVVLTVYSSGWKKISTLVISKGPNKSKTLEQFLKKKKKITDVSILALNHWRQYGKPSE